MFGGLIEASPGRTTEVQEELQEALRQETAKRMRLEVFHQVLILLLTDNKKLLMQWRGPNIMESGVGANDYRVKMGSKYIAREPEVDMIPTSIKDAATRAITKILTKILTQS